MGTFRITNGIIILHCSFLFTACSPINSLEPFNSKQANCLIQHQTYPIPAKEHISIQLPKTQNWKSIDLSAMKFGSPLMLIPYNQSLTNWTESIRTKIRSYIKAPNLTANIFVAEEIHKANYYCQYVNAHVIEKTSHFIIYRLDVNHCQSADNLIQFGKVFNGIDGVYLIYYSAIPCTITKTQFNLMSNVIKEAKLEQLK